MKKQTSDNTYASTPKSMRLQIGIFGRTNVGKSSFLNMMANQDYALVSEIPGTTTDIVEKAMELLPIGPVTFLDTAGIDDISSLSEIRIDKTKTLFNRAEIAILIIEPEIWGKYEEDLVAVFKENKIAYIIVVNKIDETEPSYKFMQDLHQSGAPVVAISTVNPEKREKYVELIKSSLLKILPAEYNKKTSILGDLIQKGDTVILICPIDSEAPKGRLILPQVQTIRDILDNDAISIVVKETEYPGVLSTLCKQPALVVCDSQVVDYMVANTPAYIKCTTFSILFSRFKGDIMEDILGAAAINKLNDGDRVLIAEACTHHPSEDDIGRVKIPRWLRNYSKKDIVIDIAAGRNYPDNLEDYSVIIHCGACMLTRHEKLVRMHKAIQKSVPISNYGMVISLLHGVLERVLAPFPDALALYKDTKL